MKGNPYTQTIVLRLAVLAAAVAGLRAYSAPPSPPGPNVLVVNTTTNPVPVIVRNFPTGTNTVQVSSSTNSPVFVRDVPRETFSTNATVFLTNGVFFRGVEIFTPPAGKRAVIETVTVSVTTPPGTIGVLAEIDDDSTPHVITLTPQGTFLGRDFLRGTFPIRFYSRGHIIGRIDRDPATGDASGFFSISGYFEDAP